MCLETKGKSDFDIKKLGDMESVCIFIHIRHAGKGHVPQNVLPRVKNSMPDASTKRPGVIERNGPAKVPYSRPDEPGRMISLWIARFQRT